MIYTLTNSQGTILSHTNGVCGSLKSPWIIQTDAGQTIELFLFDFMALDRARRNAVGACSDIYGFIVEKTLNINETICGQNRRETVIYTSKTNELEIYLIKTTSAYYLLKHRGNTSSSSSR